MKSYAIALWLQSEGERVPSRQLGEFPDWQIAEWEAATRRRTLTAWLAKMFRRPVVAQVRSQPC